MAQSVTPRAALRKFGLGVGLALLVTLPVFVSPGDTPADSPRAVALTGNSDWTIVPADIKPPFIFNGTDRNLYVRHLPLVGRIALAGRAVAIQGKISAD